MPVMLIGDADLPEEVYAGMVGQLTPRLRAAKGFICHAGGPNPAGGLSRSGNPKRTAGTGLTTTSSPTCHQASSRSKRITCFTPRSRSRPPAHRVDAGGWLQHGAPRALRRPARDAWRGFERLPRPATGSACLALAAARQAAAALILADEAELDRKAAHLGST